jgi:RNA polymerase sigma factor (sigma-70 family)
MENPRDYLPMKGDQKITWGSFYRQWRPLFFKQAHGICHDAGATDDIVQEAMRKVLDRVNRGDIVFKHTQNAVNYVVRAVRNCAKDWVKRESKGISLEEIPDPPSLSVEEELLDKEAEEIWEKCKAELVENIGKLTKDDRLLLKYRFWDGMTLAEIHEKTGIPITTIAYRINAAIKKLRDMAGED